MPYCAGREAVGRGTSSREKSPWRENHGEVAQSSIIFACRKTMTAKNSGSCASATPSGFPLARGFLLAGSMGDEAVIN